MNQSIAKNFSKLTEVEKKIYDGYFNDEQIKDRELSDWAGDWLNRYKNGLRNEFECL